jgi:hypothetical protein
MVSAAKAEIAGLFVNGQERFRVTLNKLIQFDTDYFLTLLDMVVIKQVTYFVEQ